MMTNEERIRAIAQITSRALDGLNQPGSCINGRTIDEMHRAEQHTAAQALVAIKSIINGFDGFVCDC